jgi:hypothetical protein
MTESETYRLLDGIQKVEPIKIGKLTDETEDPGHRYRLQETGKQLLCRQCAGGTALHFCSEECLEKYFWERPIKSFTQPATPVPGTAGEIMGHILKGYPASDKGYVVGETVGKEMSQQEWLEEYLKKYCGVSPLREAYKSFNTLKALEEISAFDQKIMDMDANCPGEDCDTPIIINSP